MINLDFNAMNNIQNVNEVEEFKKEYFSLNTPKHCNDQEINSDILNDGLLDIWDLENNIQSNVQNYVKMFNSMDESYSDYAYFQHSISEESSIISYPDQISPNYLSLETHQNEYFKNYNTFSCLEDRAENNFLSMSSFSKYQNCGNMQAIILQPVIPTYNAILSPNPDNQYSDSLKNVTSNILNVPSDRIVYVSTPVRDLQSNNFYNSSYTNDIKYQMNLPYINIYSYQNVNEGVESLKFTESLATIKSEIILKDLNATKKIVQTEKTFCCSTCDVKFTRRDELRRHEKIHSGEKPLSCPYCEKCFIRSDHRKTHIRTHTGEKPYTCDICHKQFARSDEKLRHTKTHNRERPRRRRRKKAPETPYMERFNEQNMQQEHSATLNWEFSNYNYFNENESQNCITSINKIFNTES